MEKTNAIGDRAIKARAIARRTIARVRTTVGIGS
jgi:hypothetical protein